MQYRVCAFGAEQSVISDHRSDENYLNKSFEARSILATIAVGGAAVSEDHSVRRRSDQDAEMTERRAGENERSHDVTV